jgi:phytoene dehydrogenase-like protein
MARYDAVFVGSGINSLAGAALLAKAGWRVCVLERNDWLGGAIRTVEGLTVPGYTHEVFASWHPLWTGSPAYEELKPDLDRLGLEYLNTDLPTATAFPDGSSAFLSTDGGANVAALGEAWQRQFDAFMAHADVAFGVLGTELWSPAGLALGRQAFSRFGRRGLVEFTGSVLATARDWLTETFEDEHAHGLLAPWVLHTGLGPDQATSGFMTQVIACALQLGGMPVPRGGGVRLVEGLATIVRDAGGELRTEADVERILVAGGRATGVRLADGEVIGAERAVLACVTPTQLYGRLLADAEVPPRVTEAARRFRYGRGEMQIHLALDELPRWRGDERLARTPIVHVTPGLDGVSRAVNEADRGLLPAEATIVCGQPVALDASRAPEGAWILWLQLQEVPSRPRGDAAGELDDLVAAAGGAWTEELREAYADRIVARLGSHVENLDRATVGRVVLSPVELEAANPNWVGGDIYGGSCALDQNLLWRPTPATPGHATPVDRLLHIGASTHPGPGLGAGSGYLAAKRLTRPPLPRRLLARLPGVGA